METTTKGAGTMTERRRSEVRYATLGFKIVDELEGEECVECGSQATNAHEDANGLVHYCDGCAPK